MHAVFVVSILLFSCLSGLAQTKSKKYAYTIDLTTVANDRVKVELIPPESREKEILFQMPRIIPGTYAVADYGRYIHDVRAFDKRGHDLSVSKLDVNTWKVNNASKLAKITYWVDDSFDTEVEGPEIFWPAGTNIQDDENFILNPSGFFGYINDIQDIPFEFTVIRKPDFYGSTGLIPLASGVRSRGSQSNSTAHADSFRASNYEELIDSPLMYSRADTAVIKVANTQVLIGSYSPNKRVTAREIAESIREVLHAQTEYLGGRLPVDKYAFIFYFTDQPVVEYGALEHNYSSVYYMPESPISDMKHELQEFAAHEFFHIITPLSIHSEYIEDFDFNTPKMSQHLWMYEGVIEYFASHVQVQYGLITPEEFLQIILEKMLTADQFLSDVSFTDISKHTHDKYHDQFYNFYQKGALIALCLDIKLRKISAGKYGLRNLMLDLSKKYGKEKAFKDDELFDEMARMTHPDINEFFNRYVKGIEKLPLKKMLGAVGVEYIDEEKFLDYSLGISHEDIDVAQVDNKPKLQVASTERQNAMGVALGLQEGDILLAINDEPLPDLGPELGEVLKRHYKALPERKNLSYTVLRKNESGQLKEVKLTAPVIKIEKVKKHVMQFKTSATPEQLKLREAWLKP
jgi:predicted metalloprotease with PDZ domain